jgi:hypothetical protein
MRVQPLDNQRTVLQRAAEAVAGAEQSHQHDSKVQLHGN